MWLVLMLAAGVAPQPQGTGDLGDKMREILARPQPPSPGDILYKELVRFRGRPAQYAFDRLGYPDRKMAVEGATVYSWINNDTNLDGGALTCTVKVVVRAKKIVSTDFNGNNGACARYARALDPDFKWPR